MKKLLSVVAAAFLAISLQSPPPAFASFGDGARPASAAEAAAGTVPVEDFENAGDWAISSGSGSLSAPDDATQGQRSLRLDYDLTARSFEIARATTPQDINTTGMRTLRMDVKGDGTFNTLYLRLRDASGEVLYYRVGNLNNKDWMPMSIDLSRPPAATMGGNNDGIIDAPASLFRLVVVRNGTQSATGSVQVDNLSTDDTGWTSPSASSASIIPGSGTVDVSFSSGGAGDYRLSLSDPSGKVKTFAGTVQEASIKTITWNGSADGGESMGGVIRGALEYDATPDGEVSGAMSVATPYLLGAARRAESVTRGSPAAVNSALTTYDSLAKADRDAAAMEEAYVRYAREEFEWNRVEPREGFFDWPKFDQAVAVASARNVKIIGKLVYTADWATSAPPGTPSSSARYYPPSDYQDYVDYAVAVVEHFKDDVNVWEVWNEPNISTYWRPAPDAAAYAELLKRTYAAIKQVQPDAIVLSGGLAGYSEPFMNGMLNAGAMQSFDGFGLHTYVEGAPEASIHDTWISAAESFLARHAPGRAIWITETGWSTCSTCDADAGVTEVDQANFLSRSMLDAAEHGVAAYAWFNLFEFGTSGSRLDNFGLIEQSGRRKPAYTAFARTASAIAGSVAAGSVSPSVGTSTVLNELANTTGIRATSVGLNAKSSLQPVSARVAGTGAIALDYNFDASTAKGTAISLNIPVPGEPSAVSVWVYGDNSSSPLYMKVTDAKGEIFDAKVGNAGTSRWERQTLYFDGLNPNFKSYGANVDGKVDYPITVTELHVFKSGTSKTHGRIILDDIVAHYGSSTRGSILYGRNFVTQAVYRNTPMTMRLPVSNTTAYAYDRGALQALNVNGELKGSLTVSSMPKFIVSTHLISPPSAQPNQPVSLRMVTGDRTTLTLQITTSAGKLVRTLTDSRAFTSGARDFVWDGMRSNGTPAPPGSYRFRLEAFGPDGRSVAWGRPFTIIG
jgi:hypothetical protein